MSAKTWTHDLALALKCVEMCRPPTSQLVEDLIPNREDESETLALRVCAMRATFDGGTAVLVVLHAYTCITTIDQRTTVGIQRAMSWRQ